MNGKQARKARQASITLSQTVSADITLDNVADARRHLALGILANVDTLALAYASATRTGRKSKNADADLQRSHEAFESVVSEYLAIGRKDAAARQAARRLITVGFIAKAQLKNIQALDHESQVRWILATRTAMRTTDVQTAKAVDEVRATLVKEWRTDPAAVMRGKVTPRKRGESAKGKGKAKSSTPPAKNGANTQQTPPPANTDVPKTPVVGSSDPSTVPTWKGLMKYVAALHQDCRNGLASKDELLAIADADRKVATEVLALVTAMVSEDATRRELATVKPVTPARAPRKSRKSA